MAAPPSLGELLDGHVTLDVEYFDRIYANVCIPKLQSPGGVVYFLHDHRGNAIPSPALFRPMGEAFRDAVRDFAEDQDIPLIRFKPHERKIDVVRPYLEEAEGPGPVVVGQAQENQWVTMGTDVRRDRRSGCPHYSFPKVERRVTVYYFYIADPEWGPCFIKTCAYFPYPSKIWCNGPYEWAKRRLESKGIGYTALANGFASCEDPTTLHRVCAALSPRSVQALFDRWATVIPQPLTAADRAAGYTWELSMNQVEFSKTLVLDRPGRARALFEHAISDNVGLGRPSEVQVIFARRVQRNTPGQFHTRIVTDGVDPRISIHYKHSRVKEYLKEGRAIRVETVINNPTDVGCKRRIEHLGRLGAIRRGINRRILHAQRVASAPSMTPCLFEGVTLPDERAGHRTVALRYGDPRAMAVMAALTLCLHHIGGFTNKTLRPLVATLLGKAYSSAQMSYDLWRLGGKQLIRRVPGTFTYFLTPEGTRTVMLFTKTYRAIIDPLFAAVSSGAGPRASPQLRSALRVIDHTISRQAQEARVAA